MQNLRTDYTFDASGGTVTFTDPVALEQLKIITNVTDGVVIYQFNDPALGGSVAGLILTLEYDTAAMSDSDDLQIITEEENGAVTVSGTVAVSNPFDGQVSGEVAVSNFPASQVVEGSVSVSNFPASQNVVVTSALPAGTNNIGDVDVLSLPALPAGSNNIGDVDVLTLPALPAGTNAIGKLAANDGVDIGDVTINNPSIPVTQGTAANLNMTEASASAIKTAVETIDNFISGSRGLVTEDNSAAIKTSVELLDDAVYTDDTSTHTTASSKGLGVMAVATPSDASVNANDFGHLAMTTDRKLQVSVPDAITVNSHAVTQGTAANLNMTEASAAAIKTAVEIMDDWDESDRCKVNVISGQAGVQGGSGGVSASTQRVVLATDVALPTGTNSIGKVDINNWSPKPNSYAYNIPSQVHVAGANTVHWDMFNADASLVVRVTSILQIPNITTAVTGIVFDWLLERTTSVGTGGSAQTAWLGDLNDTAMDADITCRSKPSGGASQSTDLFNYSLSSEETNAATIQIASQGGLELVPPHLRPVAGGKGIVLRNGQGLRCVQVTNSNQGNTGWLICFSVE